MERTNDSSFTEFVLVGLSVHPKLKLVLFVVVLCMYLIILLANGVLITVIFYDSHLNTPCIFFSVILPSWTFATQALPSHLFLTAF